MSTTPTPITPDAPIEFVLADGSVIKGATVQEAMENAGKRVSDNQAAYRDQKALAEEQKARAERAEERLAEYERLQAERAQQVNQAAETQEPQASQVFDNQRYYELLNTDPIAAQNYMDQYRFGVQDPVSAFNQMRNRVDRLDSLDARVDSLDVAVNYKSGLMAARNFAEKYQDFPGDDPRAIEAMQARVAGLIRSDQFGADISETLDIAYRQLVAEGVITPVRDETEAPPPSLSGSGGSMSYPDADADRLSTTDLEKLLRSKGML